VQDIPKCARYTQMCKIYPNAQDIPKCARYTQMCKIYPNAQDIRNARNLNG